MSQKKLVVMTLAIVIISAVFVNEMVIRNVDENRNRDVANSSQRFQPEQIKWEQELARTVSEAPQGKTVLAVKPNLSEKFLYEALQGRYEAQVVDGRILKISLMANREALNLDTDDIFKKYSEVFKGAKKFSRKIASEAHLESIHLIGENSQDIGLVKIQRDNQGRVLGIEVQ